MANLPAVASISAFVHTVLRAFRRLFHLRRLPWTFNPFNRTSSSSDTPLQPLQTSSRACSVLLKHPIVPAGRRDRFSLVFNSIKSAVTVSNSMFSDNAPSTDLYIWWPFDSTLLPKSTNCTTVPARERVASGSSAMAASNEVERSKASYSKDRQRLS
jgi:hypothetical protein